MKTYDPNKKGFRFETGGVLLSPLGAPILTIHLDEIVLDEALELAKIILKAIDEAEEEFR